MKVRLDAPPCKDISNLETTVMMGMASAARRIRSFFLWDESFSRYYVIAQPTQNTVMKKIRFSEQFQIFGNFFNFQKISDFFKVFRFLKSFQIFWKYLEFLKVFCDLRLDTIFDDNFRWQFLMTIFDDNFLGQFLMTIADDN